MGAVYASKEGIAAASVAALNAGVDLILIAYDPAQYFTMMDALLAADQGAAGCRRTGLPAARGGWPMRHGNYLNFLHLCHQPATQSGGF